MTATKSYFLFLIIALAAAFFTFSEEGGILPVEYVYVMFALVTAIILPFFLRRDIDRTALFGTLALLILGALSSYGSKVPSAFLYSVGPVFLLLAASGRGIFQGKRERRIAVRWVSVILLFSGCIGLLFMEPNYHGRLFLPHVGNPNYTGILYLSVFISIQICLPTQNGSWRKTLNLCSHSLLLFVIAVSESRSIALAYLVHMAVYFGLNSKLRGLMRPGVIFLVIATAVGQLAAYYVFMTVGVQTTDRVTFGFFDASNLIRVQSFYGALMVTIDDPDFLWHGVGNVDGVWALQSALGGIDHVPHNWFMMMWLSNGILFTLAVLIILLRSAVRLPPYFLPGFAALLIIALIVGRAALFAPLCLFLVSGMLRASAARRASSSRSPAERLVARPERHSGRTAKKTQVYVATPLATSSP